MAHDHAPCRAHGAYWAYGRNLCRCNICVLWEACVGCRVLVGPCTRLACLRDCRDCTFWVAAADLRLEGCDGCTVHAHAQEYLYDLFPSKTAIKNQSLSKSCVESKKLFCAARVNFGKMCVKCE